MRTGSPATLAAILLAAFASGSTLHGVAPASAAAAPAGAAPTTWSPAWFASDSEVRAILKHRIDVGQATGLVVGLLENYKTRVIACGESDGPANRPLDGASVLEIGSVTKRTRRTPTRTIRWRSSTTSSRTTSLRSRRASATGTRTSAWHCWDTPSR